MKCEIEIQGTITGPKAALEHLPASAFRLASWADASAPRVQQAPRSILRAAGYQMETVPSLVRRKNRIYSLFVYRNREERETCFAFHNPADIVRDDKIGFYCRCHDRCRDFRAAQLRAWWR